MRKIICMLIVTLSISSLAFASTFTPDIIRDYEKNGEKYLAKSYEIDISNQYEFENGIELKIKDGTYSCHIIHKTFKQHVILQIHQGIYQIISSLEPIFIKTTCLLQFEKEL